MAFSKGTPALPSAPTLGAGTGTDPSKWSVASAAKFDTTGMNIPGLTGYATGQQIKDALNQLALNNKDGGQVVGPIRQILIKYAGNYTTKETRLAWTAKDNSALESWLGLLNAHNAVNPSAPSSLPQWQALYQGTNNPAHTTALTTTNPVSTTPYAIPAQPDLTDAAQKAFSAVLGRSASPQEAADFAQKYQELVKSYDSAKANAKAGNDFNAPQTPIQFAQSGQTSGEVASGSDTSLPADPMAATGVEAPPTASIAASNYAAKVDPTEASAQAAADGLGQFLTMLKGS